MINILDKILDDLDKLSDEEFHLKIESTPDSPLTELFKINVQEIKQCLLLGRNKIGQI